MHGLAYADVFFTYCLLLTFSTRLTATQQMHKSVIVSEPVECAREPVYVVAMHARPIRAIDRQVAAPECMVGHNATYLLKRYLCMQPGYPRTKEHS